MKDPPTLLTLPPELRLRIYHHAFINTTIAPTLPTKLTSRFPTLREAKSNANTYHLSIIPVASLVLVNKLISTESLPVFWNLATLDLHDLPAARMFFLKPGPRWKGKASLQNAYLLECHADPALFSPKPFAPSKDMFFSLRFVRVEMMYHFMASNADLLKSRMASARRVLPWVPWFEVCVVVMRFEKSLEREVEKLKVKGAGVDAEGKEAWEFVGFEEGAPVVIDASLLFRAVKVVEGG